MIERLIDVDLILKKDSKFYFDDSILQLWLKLTANGYEFDFVPEDKFLEEIDVTAIPRSGTRFPLLLQLVSSYYTSGNREKFSSDFDPEK